MNCRRPLIRFALLFFCLLVPALLRGEDLLPMGEIDHVAVRELPAYTAIESEVLGPVETIWEKAYRQDARYVAAVHGQPGWPVVVIYPDWETKPPEKSARLLVQLVLNTEINPDKLDTHTIGMKITAMPSATVVSCAYRGTYTLENFKAALARIEAYIQEKELKPIGPPRHLYFSNTAWTPSFMRVSEVEVPVAAGNGAIKTKVAP
jgi:hypothetical protein